MAKVTLFEELATADLVVDAIYEGGDQVNIGADPIAKLLPGAGNSGGFRAAGCRGIEKFVALYSSGEEGDWPDRVDVTTGQFVYYGDNRMPGSLLHETARGGNRLLKRVFESTHASQQPRAAVPPFFVFRKRPTERSNRSVQFLGLAVPGFPSLSMTEDLVAVWKVTEGERFQNYRSIFTILNAPVVPRRWITALGSTPSDDSNAPQAWNDWIQSGRYRPLSAEPTRMIRTAEQQIPDTPLKVAILLAVWRRFEQDPIAFEAFAAQLYQLMDGRVTIDKVTRSSVDGGMDAIGRYSLGLQDDPVFAEFALEAKCYRPAATGGPPTTVGVSEVSRLISRIRHRQFGVLVTTSVVSRQAYEEVRADRHPIIFIAGRDIAEILIHAGYNTPDRVTELIELRPF